MSEQPLDPVDVHRSLVEALLSDPRHQKAYLTEAWFQQAVDMLARLLPHWVEGLYAESGDQEERSAKMLEQVMAAPPTIPADLAKDWSTIPVTDDTATDDTADAVGRLHEILKRSLSLTPPEQSTYIPLDAEPGALIFLNGVWVKKTS